MKVARERAASAASTRDEGEIAIRLSADMEKNWGVIAALLARLGGAPTPESIDEERHEAEDAAEPETPAEAENADAPATPTQSKEVDAAPGSATADDEDVSEDDVVSSSFAKYMRQRARRPHPERCDREKGSIRV